MINVLVTGSSGMLGYSLSKYLSNSFNVHSTGKSNYVKGLQNYFSFDLKESSYKELIKWSNPDVIIHCAAITDGEFCEKHPKIADEVNGLSLKKIIDSVKENVKVIYISSDAVFSSSSTFPDENFKTNPQSAYGKSKEIGEKYLLRYSKNFNIVRTTIVGLNFNLNYKKKSFVDWIISSNLNQVKIKLFDDVIFNCISIWDFSKEIKFIIENNISDKILHISGYDLCSKYHFGLLLLDSLSLNKNHVLKGSIINNKKRFKRSLNQSLNCNFYKNKYHRALPSVQQTINEIKSKWKLKSEKA